MINEIQFALLHTPIGEQDSGRTRYAAAMYFFQINVLSDDALEVYRVHAKRDYEDPKACLAKLGLPTEIKGEKP